jgi:DNA-binding transcriptional regulator WhiA
MSLTDLGKILKEPIGKSGVNYRLKKIIELAK